METWGHVHHVAYVSLGIWGHAAIAGKFIEIKHNEYFGFQGNGIE
jgi:hypothetical protein